MQQALEAAETVQLKGMAPYLQVFDMPVAIRFYRDVLGFEIVNQSEPELGDDCNWVMLRKDGIELMLNTMHEKKNRPAVKDDGRTIGHADTTLYFGCPNVEAMYIQLSAKDIKMKGPVVTFYGFKAIYLNDPDGYRICCHWPAE
jgi:glyoxylase I family protein